MIPEFVLGNFSIPSFFVVISLSLSFLVIYLSKRLDTSDYNRTNAYDIALIIMVSGFLGGRLMHVFYEEWPYYQKYPEQILYFWQGGYVFFGGFFAALTSTLIFCFIKKINFLQMADFFTPLLSLSHAFGRLGCFLSGCCFGSKCNLPWAIENRHPTTLYLMGGELLIFCYLLIFERHIKKLNRSDLIGAVFFKWILLHSLLRLIVEYYRDDFRGAFFNLPLLGRLSVSQLICWLLILFCTSYFISRTDFFKKLSTPNNK
jgi:phosphatidylglycerol---prolipoprotein diacylglyceryl transferase